MARINSHTAEELWKRGRRYLQPTRKADIDTIMSRSAPTQRVDDIEAILNMAASIPGRQFQGVATSNELAQVLKSSRWWLRTAHALLREPYGNEMEEEMSAARKMIAYEYGEIVKLYWRARLELLVGRVIPVQYVYFTSVLRHFVELNEMVQYVCSTVRSEIEESLEAIT